MSLSHSACLAFLLQLAERKWRAFESRRGSWFDSFCCALVRVPPPDIYDGFLFTVGLICCLNELRLIWSTHDEWPPLKTAQNQNGSQQPNRKQKIEAEHVKNVHRHVDIKCWVRVTSLNASGLTRRWLIPHTFTSLKTDRPPSRQTDKSIYLFHLFSFPSL